MRIAVTILDSPCSFEIVEVVLKYVASNGFDLSNLALSSPGGPEIATHIFWVYASPNGSLRLATDVDVTLFDNACSPLDEFNEPDSE